MHVRWIYDTKKRDELMWGLCLHHGCASDQLLVKWTQSRFISEVFVLNFFSLH